MCCLYAAFQIRRHERGGRCMTEKPNSALIRSDLTYSLDENMERVKKIMNIPPNQDVILREAYTCGFRICLIFLDGMVGRTAVDQFIIAPCLAARVQETIAPTDRADYVMKRVVAIDDAVKITGFEDLIRLALIGKTLMLIDGCAEGLAMETCGYEKRAVGKTSNESVVYGPKEGFVENLRTNITLIRRIVHSADLVSDVFTIGTQIPTQAAVLYIRGVVNERALQTVRRRVRSLNIPQCPGTGYLQQLIEDRPGSLLPQMLETERPDRVASCLSDGQVAVVVDGSPYVLIAPVSLWHLLHASDDSFMRWQYGSFVRLIRMLGLMLSLLVPGIYVALTIYHPHMIPMELLTSIIETRAKVPFPVVVEVLIMEVSFFLLNEASTRVPSLIGSSVGLVGALILGQAAVAASIISPILIIVIALTGLGNYTVPNYGVGIGIQISRLAIVLAGTLMGLYGIILSMGMILCYLCSMTSFGEDYMAPVAPFWPHNEDIIMRAPLWKQTKPLYLSRPDTWNQKNPGPVREWRRRR